MFENKIILITGGTGSFGNAVLANLLKTNVKEIRIFSRDEKKQEKIRISKNNERLTFYLGDIRDPDSLVDAFSEVDFIFHAAALKQVPSCEFYPIEAIKTNIIGASNVIQQAIKSRVKKVVMLSTDKAVYPINAMGMSKALMEKVMISKSRFLNNNETVICATRYGNVMGSRGSVIPLFINQLKSNLPLTLTDPKMTRFLMSLEDSVDLVFHAFINGKQGEIYVQKSPASTLQNLAMAICELFNYQQKIKRIGTRHGEKLFESLISREEMVRTEDEDKYFKILPDNRNLNYEKYFVEGNEQVDNLNDYTSHNTKQLDVSEIKALLISLPFIQNELDV